MAERAAWHYVIGGLIGMASVMGIGRFVFTPLLPMMMEDLGQSASDAGLIASANYVGYLLGAILGSGGWAQGRERMVAVVSLYASAALALAMALTTSLLAFIIIRFAAGLASAFGFVFLSTVVFARLGAMGRADLQPLFFLGVGLGIAVSSLMTGGLTLVSGNWWQGWIGVAALILIGSVIASTLVERGPPMVAAPVREPPIPRNRALNRMMWAYGLSGAGYVVTATFLIAIVRSNQTVPLAESAIWLAVGLAALPSIPFWSWVGRRLGLAGSFTLACVAQSFGIVASVSIGGAAGPLIGGILLGGTFVAITAQGIVAARRLAGDSPRRAMALMTVGFSVGQIVGPLVAGVLTDLTGSFFIPSLGAALLLLASAAIAWSARSDPTLREAA